MRETMETSRLREGRRRRHSTEYVAVNARLCDACGDCVEVCRKDVLDLIRMPGHKHVRTRHPEECTGCGKCVAVCPRGAIVLRTPIMETVS